MFTLYEVDDDHIVVRSADSGDIARVFRLLNYDLPVPSGTRLNSVYVTIYREPLDKQDSHDENEQGSGDAISELEPELPF